MTNTDQPPRVGRRITLGELLSSLLLFAAGLGLYRNIFGPPDVITGPGDLAGETLLVTLRQLSGVLGAFMIGAGLTMPIGLLACGNQYRIGCLVLVGGLAGILCGCILPAILMERPGS